MDKDLLWKEFDKGVDLYKFYLELVIKINVFVFASTGAICMFVFQNSSGKPILLALVFPFVLCASLAFICFVAATWSKVMCNSQKKIQEYLGFQVPFEFSALTYFLRVFGVAYIIICFGLLGLMAWRFA